MAALGETALLPFCWKGKEVVDEKEELKLGRVPEEMVRER